MGERKVLNKYYPPDFDPAKIPRAQRPKNQQIKVRMMLPMSIRCNTCGTYIYKGTKFNSRKEDVVGETYLGIQMFRFYFKCTKCSAELTIKTDPQNSDYVVESGAARNYEPWRATDEAVEIEKRKREAEEMGDAMKSLENRAQDSKQDMDIMASLEEMRSLKSRHATVSIDDVLATLHHIKQEKEQKMMDEIDKADEEVIKSILFPGHKDYVRRIQDDEEDEDDFYEKVKSRAGVPSIVEKKPTDALSKTSIFNSSKNSEEGISGPSRMKPIFVVKRKSDIQPAKKLCVGPVTENNKPDSTTDGSQAENDFSFVEAFILVEVIAGIQE